MQRKKCLLVAVILAGLLMAPAFWLTAVPAWAQGGGPVCTIINESGIPDDQVYLSFLGKVGDAYYRLAWGSKTFVPCTEADNLLPVPGQTDKYCYYFISLDKIKDQNGKYTFPVPTNDGGRLWVSLKKPVLFHINAGGGLREPSTDNASDPNYQTMFDKFEITYNSLGVTANTTCVDFFCLPLMFELKNGGTSLGKLGLNRTQKTVAKALGANALLRPLVTPYRVLSPKTLNPAMSFPADYFDNYVAYCWDYYKTHPLTLTALGVPFTGGVIANTLTLVNAGTGETHTIARPTSLEVFACNGPFLPVGSGDFNARDGQLKNEVAQALNRTVMHLAVAEWSVRGNYYQRNGLGTLIYRTNIYSQILHGQGIDQKIYGFPYDEKGEAAKLENQPATDIILTINRCVGGNVSFMDLLLLD